MVRFICFKESAKGTNRLLNLNHILEIDIDPITTTLIFKLSDSTIASIIFSDLVQLNIAYTRILNFINKRNKALLNIYNNIPS